MVRLSETDDAINWLGQFQTRDQSTAVKLLDSMRLVSHDDFFNGLHDLVASRASALDGPVGLYAEREIRKYRGIPNRLFKETKRKKKRRAFGHGPRPVAPIKYINPEVGSEGLVARIITELNRQDSRKFLNHPGPDIIREKKIRSFFLLTDLIGSGERSSNYLTSVWRLASVKSWRSSGLLRFEVITYSATDSGARKVRRHPSRPEVRQVLPCPMIQTEFDGMTTSLIKRLCIRYDPVDRDPIKSLGFEGTGALIVFGHGCPNNAPRILHKKTGRWTPLFPGRVTASSRAIFDLANQVSLTDRLRRIGETRLATGCWTPYTTPDGHKIILTLASLRRGPRLDEVLARKTGLTIQEILILLEQTKEWGWIDDNRRLTDSGIGILRHARALSDPINNIEYEQDELYYPIELRAPLDVSS